MNDDKTEFRPQVQPRLKRVTQGYVIALQRGIDCSSLPTGELAAMLDELGVDSH